MKESDVTYRSKIPSDAVRLALLEKPQTPANILVAIEGLRFHLDDQHQRLVAKITARHDEIMNELAVIERELRIRARS